MDPRRNFPIRSPCAANQVWTEWFLLDWEIPRQGALQTGDVVWWLKRRVWNTEILSPVSIDSGPSFSRELCGVHAMLLCWSFPACSEFLLKSSWNFYISKYFLGYSLSKISPPCAVWRWTWLLHHTQEVGAFQWSDSMHHMLSLWNSLPQGFIDTKSLQFRNDLDADIDNEIIQLYSSNDFLKIVLKGKNTFMLQGLNQPLINRGQEEIFLHGRVFHNCILQGFLHIPLKQRLLAPVRAEYWTSWPSGLIQSGNSYIPV